MNTGPCQNQHALVENLVARSGLPASPNEIGALADASLSIFAAIERLYAIPMDHETEAATELTHPDT